MAVAIVVVACAQASGQTVPPPAIDIPNSYGAAPPAAGGATPIYGGAPQFDPYALPGAAAPPANVPYSYAPPAGATYSPAAPITDPYAAAPYSPSQGAAMPNYAPPPDSGWGGANPFAWEEGAYGFESTDGSQVTYQKFMQELAFEHTYLYGDHSADALEIHRLEMWSTLAFPLFGNIDSPLLLTPGFAFNWLEGPLSIPIGPFAGPDLPPRLYDAYLDVAWNPQPTPFFGAELGVRTGVWTDFKEVNGDSVRVIGRGMAKARINPSLEVLLGAVYLDRVRVKVLPAGGFRYRPNELWDIDVVFPYPRVRRRLPSTGTVDWRFFVAGEYGGGSWTVRRDMGRDRIDYNDIRVSCGLEWENARQVTGHFEVGVVFDREVIYGETKDPPRYAPDTTVMMRGGVDF